MNSIAENTINTPKRLCVELVCPWAPPRPLNLEPITSSRQNVVRQLDMSSGAMSPRLDGTTPTYADVTPQALERAAHAPPRTVNSALQQARREMRTQVPPAFRCGAMSPLLDETTPTYAKVTPQALAQAAIDHESFVRAAGAPYCSCCIHSGVIRQAEGAQMA